MKPKIQRSSNPACPQLWGQEEPLLKSSKVKPASRSLEISHHKHQQGQVQVMTQVLGLKAP